MLFLGFNVKDIAKQSCRLLRMLTIYPAKVHVITKTYSYEQYIYKINLNICRGLPKGMTFIYLFNQSFVHSFILFLNLFAAWS